MIIKIFEKESELDAYVGGYIVDYINAHSQFLRINILRANAAYFIVVFALIFQKELYK